MIYSAQDVSIMVQQEAENLDPRRTLTSHFKNVRDYFQTHPTLLETVVYQSRLDPLALLFLAGCKQTTSTIEFVQLLGCAVHADSPGVKKLQRIICIITRSHVYEIGEIATTKYKHFEEEKGTFSFDIENAWSEIVVTDSSLVQQEADVIFQEVQELDDILVTCSQGVQDLIWWSLSSWLACVISVCCAAELNIDPKHSALVERVITGNFPAKALSAELAHHPLTRIYFGC